MTTYRIPAANFPRLEEEIEKLNKRATKLQMEPVKLTVLQTENVTRKDDLLGFEYHETFYICTVEGEAPKLAGWQLIASVQPVGDENLIREVPGQGCPTQYRKADPLHCDHCHFRRRRNAIFVLLHEETQEYKQVGSTCIGDFLGTKTPESILGAAEYMFDFVRLAGEAQEESWGWGGGQRVVPIQHFVGVVSILNRRLGYVSRTAAREQLTQATADLAWSLCTDRSAENRKFIEEKNLYVDDVDWNVAKAALEWAAGLSPDTASSNYLHDLGVCCRQNVVTWDRAGYVSSVLQAYNMHLQQEAIRAGHPSKHVGEVGKRQPFKLTIVSCRSQEGDWGATMLVHFKDEAGNVLVWWSSRCPDWLVAGREVEVTATVKKHDQFQGINRTVLTLVKPVKEKKVKCSPD